MTMTIIKPELCKAARMLTYLSQEDLANNSGIGIATIRRLECGKNISKEIQIKIVNYFLSQNVEIRCTDEFDGLIYFRSNNS